MRDTEFDDELDLDTDRRLREFARSTGEPALPDEVAQLPWTVQVDQPRKRPADLLGALSGGFSGFQRAAVGFARLGIMLAIAGSFLLVVGNARSGGSGANLVQPPATPSNIGNPGSVADPDSSKVVVAVTSGVVDDVMADFVQGAINRAQSDGAVAVVIQLDTLGGTQSAMQRIVKSLEASKVPTIVWVGPGGAKAASAGTFITLAAGLAYMAESTNIGAASPVAAGGQDVSAVYGQTEATKVMQDAVAYMTGIATRHHPQAVAWAVSTVQDARSYSADQAFAKQGINGIANSLNDVLSQADGKTVLTGDGSVVAHTKGASTVIVEEDLIQALLHTFDNPDIAFILLVIGILLVGIELFHPTLLMGLSGALCLALSFYGLGSLPLNVLGVVLVVIGIALIVLEANVPSHGLLTLVGIVVFVVGAVAFYGSPGPYLPTSSVAWPIIGLMAGLAAAYSLVLVSTLLKMRRQPAPVGAGLVGVDGVVGMVGDVQADLSPVGTVYVGRESWSATARDGSSISRGSRVRIVSQDGLTLVVEKIE